MATEGKPMKELIWLNGRIMPLAEATISVEDRGYQFADGVYEVIRVYSGKPFTLDAHLQRLENSAGGLQIRMPLSRAELANQIVKLVGQSSMGEGMIYLQLTRGVCPRNHVFSECAPTLLFHTRALEPVPPIGQAHALRLISYPDDRWRRCWIKSVALLANVLAKNAAIAAGADEAAFVENGVVAECSASNLLAIIRGKLVTHPVGPRVLPGITRAVLIECARDLDIAVEERPFLVEEAKRADELFITSTTKEIAPISSWDGVAMPGVGPVATRLHQAFRRRVEQETRP